MLLLLGYILTAPLFVLGPLVGLLLVSRPVSFREQLWLFGAGTWILLTLQVPGGLAEQLGRAFGVFGSGAFLVLTLAWAAPFLARALAAVGLATAATAAWCVRLHIGWDTVLRAQGDRWLEMSRLWATALRRAAQDDPAAAARADEVVLQLQSSATTLGALAPGLLVLGALAGMAVAWAVYHRVATRPMGAPAAPLRRLRFSDQFVWGWVVALGLLVSPLPDPLPQVGSNLALVWTALYAARGLGVIAWTAERVPRAILFTLGVVSLFLLPLVAGGLALLGLTDTWLDFRRRLASSPTGGFDR